MYEICFSDSAKGALSVAGTKGKAVGGTVGFIFSDGKKHPIRQIIERRKLLKRQKRLIENAVPIDIDRENLLAIGVDFSLGDISKPLISGDCPQKQLISEMLRNHSAEDDVSNSINVFWDSIISDAQKLNTAAQNGAEVRIWADRDVRGQCGLAFVCSVLNGSGCNILIVEAPQAREDLHGKPVPCCSFGEAEPLTIGQIAAQNTRELTEKQTEELAALWEALKSENAPLRVLENGRIKSADIDYYDKTILEETSEKACSIGEIIGKVIGRRNVRVSDYIIAKRISAMLESGKLKLTEKSKVHYYSDKIAINK